jgi:hypothetical protein
MTVNPKWTEFWMRTTNFILFKSVFKQNREENAFVSYVNLGLRWPKPRCNSSLDSVRIFCSTTDQLNCKCYVPWVLLWFIFKCKRIFSKLLHNCLVTFWWLIVCKFILCTFFTLTYNNVFWKYWKSIRKFYKNSVSEKNTKKWFFYFVV